MRALLCILLLTLTPVATAENLNALQADLTAAIDRAQHATVAIHLGGGTGSGVVVSPDGLILSVAHVTGSPGQRAAVYFADGSVAAAETLGLEIGTDCGMLRLLGGGPWPFIPLATPPKNPSPTTENNADTQPTQAPANPHPHPHPNPTIQPGQPVLALGHPGGFNPERPVTARFGHVIAPTPPAQPDAALSDLQTTATLSAGDSGGPLLNRDGQVIAIHARIGARLDQNYHVPVERFMEQWAKLLAGGRTAASLGVVGRDALAGFAIGSVQPDSPAADAGLIRGDVILGFNGMAIGPQRNLRSFLALRRPGDTVQLRVARRGQLLRVELTLAEPLLQPVPPPAMPPTTPPPATP